MSWSWWLEKELPDADLAQADVSDSPVVPDPGFDGDRSRLSSRFHMVSELTRLMTGNDLPYATLSYVWTWQYPPGTLLNNPRSDRIRYLVVESGPSAWASGCITTWSGADFQRVRRASHCSGLMADTDNTGARPTPLWPGGLHSRCPGVPSPPLGSQKHLFWAGLAGGCPGRFWARSGWGGPPARSMATLGQRGWSPSGGCPG